jgi:hypothetical protein
MNNNKEKLYVIGFPKSGNTWISRLLSDVLNSNMRDDGRDDKVNSAINSSNKKGKYLICKIHRILDGDSLKDIKKSKKVYVIRDPRAVMTSGFFYNYSNFSEERINTSQLLKLFFNYEINVLNKSWQNNIFFRLKIFARKLLFLRDENPEVGGWSNHVKYWQNFDDIVIVKYEDFLSNTEVELSQLIHNLDISVDSSLIKEAVKRHSFNRMKNEFMQKKDFTNVKFMRTGKKDSWINLLDNKIQKNIEQEHKDIMNIFKYTKE